MRNFILFILFAFGIEQAVAQNNATMDSLLQVLSKAKEDTAKVLLYINIGNEIENTDPQKAGEYYLQAGALSKKLNYKKGILKFISNYTYILNVSGKLDSALILNVQAVDIAQTLGDKIILAKCYANLGNSYNYLNDLENALSIYQKALKTFETADEKYLVAKMQDVLQNVYQKLNQPGKGIFYGEAAVKYFRETDRQQELAISLLNIANNYTDANKKDLAFNAYSESLKISKEIVYKIGEIANLLGIGNYYYHRFEADKSRPNYEQALIIAEEVKDVESEVVANRGLSLCYLIDKDFEKSDDYINQSLRLAKDNKLEKEIISSFKVKSSILYVKHDVISAEKYLDSVDILQQKLFGDEVKDKILNLDKKYETEKKEAQIQFQEARIKQKNILNYILTGCAICLLGILFLLYRNYNHRKKLQQQEIAELQTEKQLSATEAILKGEEQERTRLAKDLHDGLGGMLSGIKFSLSNMKQNLIMTPDNVQAFERSIDMLDSSIKEMRRVAHNMMPEVLVKYGLDTALKDYCGELERSGVIQVNYHSMDMDKVAIDHTVAVTIYRIVQELVNNTIKHASAKNVLVQAHVSAPEKLLAITVEDDGIGFDKVLLSRSTGIGWSNIQNRVDFLKGKVDVKSGNGKGTSVLIEINI